MSRRAAVAETAKSLGGKLEAFYFAFGDHDAVVILDLPDNEAAAAVALAVDAAGGASTTTTVLLTPEQVDDAGSARSTPSTTARLGPDPSSRRPAHSLLA